MSNSAEQPRLEVVETEPVMSKDEALSMLVAIGANACSRSYDAKQKKLYIDFVDMPLVQIAKSWGSLEDNVKIAVLKSHQEEFLAWVNKGA